MSDENKPLQVEAVREPLDAGRTEMAAAAVDQADSPAEAEAAPGSGALDLESSPLGAYRRGRTRGADRSDETVEAAGEYQG
jgi:hypothetical protein